MIFYILQTSAKLLLAICISVFIVAVSEVIRLYVSPKGIWSSDPAMLITIPVLFLICDFLFSFLDRYNLTGAPLHLIFKLLIYAVLGFLIFQFLNYAFFCYISYWSSDGKRLCFPMDDSTSGNFGFSVEGVALYINGVATEAGKLSEILDRTKQFALHAIAGLLWELTLPPMLAALSRVKTNF